jgi:hypothetical protein
MLIYDYDSFRISNLILFGDAIFGKEMVKMNYILVKIKNTSYVRVCFDFAKIKHVEILENFQENWDVAKVDNLGGGHLWINFINKTIVIDKKSSSYFGKDDKKLSKKVIEEDLEEVGWKVEIE